MYRFFVTMFEGCCIHHDEPTFSELHGQVNFWHQLRQCNCTVRQAHSKRPFPLPCTNLAMKWWTGRSPRGWGELRHVFSNLLVVYLQLCHAPGSAAALQRETREMRT